MGKMLGKMFVAIRGDEAEIRACASRFLASRLWEPTSPLLKSQAYPHPPGGHRPHYRPPHYLSICYSVIRIVAMTFTTTRQACYPAVTFTSTEPINSFLGVLEHHCYLFAPGLLYQARANLALITAKCRPCAPLTPRCCGDSQRFEAAVKALEGNDVMSGYEFLGSQLEMAKAMVRQYPEPEHFRVNINLSWKKLDDYCNKLGETPIYYTSLALHPAYRWGYFEKKWSDRLAWVAKAEGMVEPV